MPRKNKIIFRTGTGAPSAADFVPGEPAFDSSAGKLYVENAAGVMVEIGAGGGGGADEVVEYLTTADFPATGNSSLLYIATDAGRAYRWVGSQYAEVGSGGVVAGLADTALRALFVPPAPAAPTGSFGDSQVVLSWTAPTVLAQTPITDYVVQFSSNGGTTWTTFSDGTSNATSATVTGLTNGTAYVFRVAGVNGAGQGAWSSASASVTPGAPLSYLVVGGGGCGGHYAGGGGGGGGVRTGTIQSPIVGSPYTVTVGAGGATLGSASGGPKGNNGSSSSFASQTGGGGVGGNGINASVFRAGGASGSPQSNAGGAGTATQAWSGGGGGAGSVGAGNNSVPNGGSGTAFYGVNYAGGGGGSGSGGGGPSQGSGGSGGGGGGSATGGGAGTAGTINTGGGGGGGGDAGNNSGVGGAGGSGVVILRSPVAAASTTGSPTVTTDGGFTIYTFTGSGSITF